MKKVKKVAFFAFFAFFVVVFQSVFDKTHRSFLIIRVLPLCAF